MSEKLFRSGTGIFHHPLKTLYLTEEAGGGKGGTAVMFSVPKRLFKRANKRNLLKRRMREAYRKHRQTLHRLMTDQNKTMYISFTFIARAEAESAVIEQKIILTLQELCQRHEAPL